MSVPAVRLVKNYIRLPPLPTIRDVIKLYKLRAMKRLSQNFLMDERLTDKIVRNLGYIDSSDVVLEVGPGPGGITRSILRRTPQRLLLVERDPRFLPTLNLLKETVKPLNIDVDIFIDDILRFNIEEHVDPNQRLHLIGNLPFSISTRLLINWIEDVSLQRGAFRRNDTGILLTFQQEVADRICAPTNHIARCRLSVISQIWTRPTLKFTIPGKAFVPKPDVDVGVVKLIPLTQPKTNLPFPLVEKVVRHIFNMRQKHCHRGYSTLFPPEHREDITQELFNKANVLRTLKPFQLTEEECLSLTAAYVDFIKDNPQIAEYDHRSPKHLREKL